MHFGELAGGAGSPFDSSNDRQTMRELLIRYLLGELGADEHREVQARLSNSPELQQELARLRQCFAAHQDDDAAAAVPPSGLAARTTERVTGCSESAEAAAAGERAVFTHGGDPPPEILGWSLADLTVAGGVMLAVSMLIFPALRNSRDGTHRTICQNNQRQLWVLLNKYAEDHGGLYPQVGPNENAGMYVARLITKGYVQPEDIALMLVCPGSHLAKEIRSRGLVFQLPDAAALQAMTAKQLNRVTALMSPSYNIRWGYWSGGEYHYAKNERGKVAPVLSDAAGGEADNMVSPNHGGSIAQVQFGDGNLKSLRSCKLPGSDDDMYHNDLGKVAAGLRRHDIVLGSSDSRPGGELSAPAK